MTQRTFPHHEEVLATFELLKAAWIANDPRSNVALYFASYSETFLDMARAVVDARHASEEHPEVAGLLAAEQLVRDRIKSTHWASEARLHKNIANAIHERITNIKENQ